MDDERERVHLSNPIKKLHQPMQDDYGVILAEEISLMSLWPIGVIHTPYKKRDDIPRQGRLSSEICEIEVFPEYVPGLKDIRAMHSSIRSILAAPGGQKQADRGASSRWSRARSLRHAFPQQTQPYCPGHRRAFGSQGQQAKGEGHGRSGWLHPAGHQAVLVRNGLHSRCPDRLAKQRKS